MARDVRKTAAATPAPAKRKSAVRKDLTKKVTARGPATKRNTTKEYYWGVKVGRQPGVYTSAERCEAQVNGFSGAQSKRFKTQVEAEVYVHGDSEKNKVRFGYIRAAGGGGASKPSQATGCSSSQSTRAFCSMAYMHRNCCAAPFWSRATIVACNCGRSLQMT
jgi:Caulimovirus viroplasmin